MKQFSYIFMSALALTPAATMAQTDSIAGGVNVAFKQVAQQDLLGGVSVVDMEELEQKAYNNYSLNNMTSHVGGYNGQLWNQGDALVLVDGVPRDATNIMPSEISQITFLKSAAAVALYGSRAAKGAILITTKRGKEQDLQIKVRANAMKRVPLEMPKYLGAGEYMTLYNEARQNDGLAALYTPEDIYNHSSGRNPYRYPDVNYLSDEYLKSSYNYYDATAEFRGGGHFAKYYANVNFYNSGDMLKIGEGKHNHINRLSVRGNVDLRLSDEVTGWVNATATFYDLRRDNSNYWSQTATLRPNRVSPLIPISFIEPTDANSMTLINNSNYLIGGKYFLGGTQQDMTNPIAGLYAGGYNTWTSRQFQFDAGVQIDLHKLLEGLKFRTQFSVDYKTSYTTSINNGYATFGALWNTYSGTDLITSLTQYGLDSTTGTQNMSNSAEDQTILFSAQLDYNRSFGLHNLSGMLLAHGYQITTAGQYHRTSNANLGLQLGYNYDHRYYADFTAAVIHSAKLAEGHRQAISPTLSLGWRLKGERWLKDVKTVDDLKLTASVASINQDLDISDYYMYQEIYSAANYWGWSENATSQDMVTATRGGNTDLGFVKRKELTIGLQGSFFNHGLTADVNYFNSRMSGLLVIPSASFPSYFKSYWPADDLRSYVNFNEQARSGFDWTLQGKKQVGDWQLGLGLTGMYYTSSNKKYDEVVEYGYQSHKDTRIDAIWGLQSDGLLSEADIANPATPKSTFIEQKAGDIKYIDQNGDGVIDNNDNVVIGKWTAPWILGANLTAQWKGFTLYAAISGNFGGNGIKNNSYTWVYGDGKYSETVRNRWTPETAATATYPRLTTQSGDHNFRTSDFWLYSTDRLDLQQLQLSYDLPAKMFDGKWVKALKVYASAYNLLTIAGERKYMQMNVGSAPQTRSFLIGAQVEL